MGIPDCSFYVPGKGLDKAGRRDNGEIFSRSITVFMKSGEGIWLLIFRSRTIWDVQVEARKEEGPEKLSRVESFGWYKIRKVFMVSPNDYWDVCAPQPVSLFVQGKFYGRKLSIPNVILSFRSGKTYLRKMHIDVFYYLDEISGKGYPQRRKQIRQLRGWTVDMDWVVR